MKFALLALLIGGTALAAEPCKIVTVRTKFGDKPGAQGVGWVVRNKKNGRTYVLTPAHVTRGSKSAQALCEGTTRTLTRVASSPTYDLALYSVSDAAGLAPALSFPNSAALPEIQSPPDLPKASKNDDSAVVSYPIQSATIYFPQPGHENTTTNIGSSVQKISAEVSALSPYAWHVHVGSAIRPGLSGSPVYLYAQTESKFVTQEIDGVLVGRSVQVQSKGAIPVAMVVKVVGNSEDSRGIATQQILELLPDLIAGNDPWRKNSPDLPYLDYVNPSDSRVTVKTIIFPKDGYRLVDACPQGVNSTSAGGNWTDGGGHWTDGGGNWTDGGGHWTDGGGNWADGGGTGANSSKEFDLIHSNVDQYQNTVFSTFFRWSPSCKEVGLRLPNGALLTGLRPNLAVTSVEDSYGPLLYLAKADRLLEGAKLLKKYGVDTSDVAGTRGIFCNSRTLGGMGELWIGKGGLNVKKSYGPQSGTILHVMKGIGRKSLGVLSKRDRIAGTIHCNREGIEAEFGWADLAGVGTVAAKLEITPQSAQGALQVGRCVARINQRQNGMWNTHIQDRSTGLEAIYSIGPGRDGMQLVLLTVPPTCWATAEIPDLRMVVFDIPVSD